jgi:hypothetical protein
MISDAKRELQKNNVPEPYTIKVSWVFLDKLKEELKVRGRIFEVAGMTVEPDPDCPDGTAYIMRKEERDGN